MNKICPLMSIEFPDTPVECRGHSCGFAVEPYDAESGSYDEAQCVFSVLGNIVVDYMANLSMRKWASAKSQPIVNLKNWRSSVMDGNTKDLRPSITPEVAHDLAELEIMDICAEHRDGDGVRTMVYLRDQECVIDIDTCRTPELLTTAIAHLENELEQPRRSLEKAKRRAADLQ